MKTKLIALTGKARSGKTTFGTVAESLGYVPIDISKFLARMTVARLGLSGEVSLDWVDEHKDSYFYEDKVFRQHIIDTGNALDDYIPAWVISEMLRLGGDRFIIPSIKNEQQLDSILWLLDINTDSHIIKIVRPSLSVIKDVRTEAEAQFIITNDGTLEEFKKNCQIVLNEINK